MIIHLQCKAFAKRIHYNVNLFLLYMIMYTYLSVGFKEIRTKCICLLHIIYYTISRWKSDGENNFVLPSHVVF